MSELEIATIKPLAVKGVRMVWPRLVAYRLDRLAVEVEARPECPAERRETAAAEVARAVKDTVGVQVDVRVVDPDTLPRSVGKLQRLLDQRERT